MSETIMLKNVRLSFPEIWAPKAFGEGQEPKFSATYIIDGKNTAVLRTIRAAITALVAAELKGKNPPADKLCLKDAATKDYDGYEDGDFFVSTNSTSRPLIIDRDRSALAKEDGRPYAGCYVNAQINVWVQDNQWGKRVNASTNGIQFLRDGDEFGGGRASAGDFDDESEEEYEDPTG